MAEIKTLKETLCTVVDEMLEGFQIIDRNWRYVYVNKTVAKQGRMTSEALIGHTMMEKYPGIEQTFLFSQMSKCMEDRISIRMENEFTFPDGQKGWFQLFIHPCGEGILILSADISDKRKAEEKLMEKIDQLNKMTDLLAATQGEILKLKELITSIRSDIKAGDAPKVLPK